MRVKGFQEGMKQDVRVVMSKNAYLLSIGTPENDPNRPCGFVR